MQTKNDCLTLLLSVSLLLTVLTSSTAFAAPDLSMNTLDQELQAERALKAANKKDKTHIVATTMQSIFKADDSQIWKVLTDFQNYPAIFKRIESVQITKSEGELVYTESRLKPGMFVQKTIQHTVNDLSAGPTMLNWHMLDGNFKYLKGQWEIKPRTANTCFVKYTVYVDLGALVPPQLINFLIHHVQQEIVDDLKHYVETAQKSKPQELSIKPTKSSGFLEVANK